MKNNNYQELETKAKELGWEVIEYTEAGATALEDYVIMKFRPKAKLTKWEDYTVWEPGMDEWHVMTYIGYDKLRDQYIFRSPQDSEFYMYVHRTNVESEVGLLD